MLQASHTLTRARNEDPRRNPEAVVLRRNNCGTRASSRALACHLMAVFAARTPCSRYPRFMTKPGLNPYAARSVRYRSAGKDSGQFKGRARRKP